MAVTVLPQGLGTCITKGGLGVGRPTEAAGGGDVVVAAVGDFVIRVSRAAETADIGGDVKDAIPCGNPVPVADDIQCDVIKAVSCKESMSWGPTLPPAPALASPPRLDARLKPPPPAVTVLVAPWLVAGVEREVEKIKGAQCLLSAVMFVPTAIAALKTH